jgi:hypothetical protein
MLAGAHPFMGDGYGYCTRAGCGLKKKNWRHVTTELDAAEDRSEPRRSHTDDAVVLPIQSRRSKKPAGAARR